MKWTVINQLKLEELVNILLDLHRTNLLILQNLMILRKHVRVLLTHPTKVSRDRAVIVGQTVA